MCFVHPIFRFRVLVTFGDKVTKVRKCYVILGKTVKKRKENHAIKVTKIEKDLPITFLIECKGNE